MDTTGVSSPGSQSADNQWFHHRHSHGGRWGAAGNDWGHEHEGDRFTRSGGRDEGDGGNGGSFSVSEVMFSLTGSFVVAQTPTAFSSATDSTTAPSGSSQADASTTGTPTTSPAQPATSDASSTVATATSPTSPVASGITASTGTSSDSSNVLQGLNSALAALGLNQQEIGVFDQIAQLIQGFSPTAFNDIVSQIEALAQQVSQLAATHSSQNSTSGSTPDASSTTGDATSSSGGSAVPESTTVSSAPTGTQNTSSVAGSTPPSTGGADSTVPSGTVHVEELSFQFSEVQVQMQGSTSSSGNGAQGASENSNSSSQGANTSGSSLEFVAFKLQIEEITATLASGGNQGAAGQPSSDSAGSSSSGTSDASQTPQAAAA